MEISGIVKEIVERAKQNKKRIVFPESSDLRILKAAKYLSEENIADVILVGSLEEIEFLCKANNIELNFDLIHVENPLVSDKREFYINSLYELRKNKGMSMVEAIEKINDNVYFGVMMVKVNDADGMVSGAIHSTSDTLRPALQIIKAKEGVKHVSSFLLMDIPNCEFSSNGRYIFSDCGLTEYPTAEELVDIAISSSNTYRFLLNAEPKVAMLSYSTYGSASSREQKESVKNMQEATKILKEEKKVDFVVDGELQLDSAIVPEVAKLKCPTSELKGEANVLVFPNIDAGNIGYKLVQRFAHATAIGPITQGLAKPVNDLSRGANVEEIIAAASVTALQALENDNKN